MAVGTRDQETRGRKLESQQSHLEFILEAKKRCVWAQQAMKYTPLATQLTCFCKMSFVGCLSDEVQNCYSSFQKIKDHDFIQIQNRKHAKDFTQFINKKVIIKILKLAQEHFRSMMYIGNLFKECQNKIAGLDTKVVNVFQGNKL